MSHSHHFIALNPPVSKKKSATAPTNPPYLLFKFVHAKSYLPTVPSSKENENSLRKIRTSSMDHPKITTPLSLSYALLYLFLLLLSSSTKRLFLFSSSDTESTCNQTDM
ncbi:hypothetical protein Pst134EA_011839 [Puccinia striiformis f. sp. tritici]|uniref:hypothetical protein n=1 Tax=Puccinia striiformis f. sp. tritici TaxID=168172 RepID=UPI00200872BB|nr:hypothetical protein Pst134EA_011839 [Puccinia striiformis f. sp. tritici]KAH9468210.1 hypothetical protein Pst134EA_011839 [Puccinia striiformis f. sp. tritici]